MIPALLSSNICSLRGGEERLAFSCIWELTPQADVVHMEFFKSVIKSAVSLVLFSLIIAHAEVWWADWICVQAALKYSEAQMRIDDVRDISPVTEGLRALNRLAKQLRHKRLEAGALLLASTEVRSLSPLFGQTRRKRVVAEESARK